MTAVVMLSTLATEGRAAKTGYARTLFGPSWTDDNDSAGGHNGCDTRNDILRRDLTSVVLRARSNGCAVSAGELDDPYTGRTIRFLGGPTTSGAVQIDHVVALGDAWQKGAQQWGTRRRTAFANDPLNLLAVNGASNSAKGDGDAATWLPPNKAFRCAYVARQVAVKARYELSVTAAERDAMTRILTACPATRAPVEAGRPPQDSATDSATDSGSATSVTYPNCAAVKAAGRAPLRRGQPGYSTRLDGDGDGVACE